MDYKSFFQFQRRALALLLSWGIGSVAVGAAMSLRGRGAARQFGLQALVWGAIDALIAAFGMRSAQRKLAQQGRLDVVAEARRFRTIVALNALLDVGYVAAGAALARSERAERRGMGLGILVQGLFLLIFDSVLALMVQAELPAVRKI